MNEHLSHDDIAITLPNLLTSLEMPFFAIFVLHAFRSEPYRARSAPAQGGPAGLRAVIQAFNVTDLLSALVRGPLRLVRDQRPQAQKEEALGFVQRGSYQAASPSELPPFEHGSPQGVQSQGTRYEPLRQQPQPPEYQQQPVDLEGGQYTAYQGAAGQPAWSPTVDPRYDQPGRY